MRALWVVVLVLGCSAAEEGPGRSSAGSDGGGATGAGSNAGGAGAGGSGSAGETAAVAGGGSSGAAVGSGGVGGGDGGGGAPMAGGGAGGTAGTQSGKRCDFIATCKGVAEECSAALGTPCGSCKIGTYACGDKQGFYSDDGQDFPCVNGATGLDCADASLASLQHCTMCQQ